LRLGRTSKSRVPSSVHPGVLISAGRLAPQCGPRQKKSGDLRQINAQGCTTASTLKMVRLIFRCTQTGMNVQIEMPVLAPTDHPDSYESVTCPACTRIHLVNKTTGKMLGDNEKRNVVNGEK
jgi:hypothetical protein